MTDTTILGPYMAGDDLSLQFTVTDEDDTAVDITGMTVRFVAARQVAETAVISTEVSPQTASAALTTPGSGIFTVTIDSAVTDPLSGTYMYECELEDVDGDKSTVARGYITFTDNMI